MGVFFKNLKNVKLSVGDEINVGDLVGEISEWDSAPTITHVHIGIDDKKHIKEYLSVDGTLLKGSGKASESSDGDGESTSGDTKSTYDDAYSGFFGQGGNATLFDLFGSFGKMMTPKETSEVTENVNEIKKIFKKLL